MLQVMSPSIRIILKINPQSHDPIYEDDFLTLCLETRLVLSIVISRPYFMYSTIYQYYHLSSSYLISRFIAASNGSNTSVFRCGTVAKIWQVTVRLSIPRESMWKKSGLISRKQEMRSRLMHSVMSATQ